MLWIVTYSRKAGKLYDKLPTMVQDRLDLLTAEMEGKNFSRPEGRSSTIAI